MLIPPAHNLSFSLPHIHAHSLILLWSIYWFLSVRSNFISNRAIACVAAVRDALAWLSTELIFSEYSWPQTDCVCIFRRYGEATSGGDCPGVQSWFRMRQNLARDTCLMKIDRRCKGPNVCEFVMDSRECLVYVAWIYMNPWVMPFANFFFLTWECFIINKNSKRMYESVYKLWGKYNIRQSLSIAFSVWKSQPIY